MTVKQAAERLEVSPATVYALVSAGKLRCYRVGMGRGRIRIANEHIAEYLDEVETISVRPTPPTEPRPILKHIRAR